MTIALTAIEVSSAQLHAVELFNGLSEDEVLELLSTSDDLRFNTGDVVLQAGEVNRSLNLLLEGEVEIDLELSQLNERVLARLEAGSIFGEMSFFHPAPHAATAKCLTAARVMRLPRARFDALAASNPHLALRVTTNAAEILAARLHHTDEWIADSLSRQQEQETRASWRSFRKGMMSTFSGQPKSLISVGGNR